ncbi:hypothetical protein B484DRAFT_403394 [Ochromonadaceae sp. CCMP2298]|nr:hypothetical protein B484DRAFT_403394 [Ochromonadaceae sp. CCMP2298]
MSKSSTQVRGFADPNWNWGSSQGTGHDAAMLLRGRLRSRESREQFLEQLGEGTDVDADDMKLCLALRWQSASREGGPGAEQGWRLMGQMADCRYEGGGEGGEGDQLLLRDLLALLQLLPPATPGVGVQGQGSVRLAAAQVLRGMRFVEKGL